MVFIKFSLLLNNFSCYQELIHPVHFKVGVGEGDMGALVQLDSDRARLSWGEEQADRDIVQFVGERI